MAMWIWTLALAWGADAFEHDRANEEDLLIVELIDPGAAARAELRCPSGYRDAGTFTYGRVVLRAPEEGCALVFEGDERSVGEVGPGELLCDLSGETPDCLSVCDADAP